MSLFHRKYSALLLLIGRLALLNHHHGEADAFALSSSIRPAAFSPCKNCKLQPIISASSRGCSIGSRHSIISLAASADNNEEISNEFQDSDNEEERAVTTNSVDTVRHHLSSGYSLAAIMNIAAAISLLWGSCRASKSIITSSPTSTSIQLLSNNIRYWDPTFTSSMLSYLLLGAGTCQILSNITKHSPQQDERTKQQQLLLRQRLTIGTLLFSTIGLFSIPGDASYHYQQLNHQVKFVTSLLLCQLSKLITAAVSFIGWEDTIPNGFDSSSSSSCGKNILCEVGNGIKNMWTTMPISSTHPASFYRTLFIIVTLGNVAFNVPNLVFYLREGVNWFSVPVSTIVSSIGRGSMLSMILFVLKEEHASRSVDVDNGETKGSGTFVVLNMLVGLWAVGGKCESVCAI